MFKRPTTRDLFAQVASGVNAQSVISPYSVYVVSEILCTVM